MCTRRPFTNAIDNVQAIIAEGGTVAVSVLTSAYAFEISEGVKETIDVAGVWTVRLILIASTGLSVVKLGFQLARALRKYKKTADIQRVVSVESGF